MAKAPPFGKTLDGKMGVLPGENGVPAWTLDIATWSAAAVLFITAAGMFFVSPTKTSPKGTGSGSIRTLRRRGGVTVEAHEQKPTNRIAEAQRRNVFITVLFRRSRMREMALLRKPDNKRAEAFFPAWNRVTSFQLVLSCVRQVKKLALH
jgi:hypothetical protein